MIKGIISLFSGLVSFANLVGGWLRDRGLRMMGRKEQALESAQEINALHNEAAEIDAEPPMDKQSQLDWMRKSSTKDN